MWGNMIKKVETYRNISNVTLALNFSERLYYKKIA